MRPGGEQWRQVGGRRRRRRRAPPASPGSGRAPPAHQIEQDEAPEAWGEVEGHQDAPGEGCRVGWPPGRLLRRAQPRRRRQLDDLVPPVPAVGLPVRAGLVPRVHGHGAASTAPGAARGLAQRRHWHLRRTLGSSPGPAANRAGQQKSVCSATRPQHAAKGAGASGVQVGKCVGASAGGLAKSSGRGGAAEHSTALGSRLASNRSRPCLLGCSLGQVRHSCRLCDQLCMLRQAAGCRLQAPRSARPCLHARRSTVTALLIAPVLLLRCGVGARMRLQLAGRGRGSKARLHKPSLTGSASSCGWMHSGRVAGSGGGSMRSGV